MLYIYVQMSSVDPEGALSMYTKSGDWEKCLELAEKQGGAVLTKYVALYAAELIKTNAPLSALKLFAKYGAPANPQVHEHSHVHVQIQQCTCSINLWLFCQLRISTSTRGCVLRCTETILKAPAATLHTQLSGIYCSVWYVIIVPYYDIIMM